ncbi:hypothetical protein RQP46_001543 [Phenoliferia psychrophenolica]
MLISPPTYVDGPLSQLVQDVKEAQCALVKHGILFRCFGDRMLHSAINVPEDAGVLASGIGTAILIQNPINGISMDQDVAATFTRERLLVMGLRKKHWSAAVRSLVEAVSGRIKLCEVDIVPLVFLSKGNNKSEAVALGRGIMQSGCRMTGRDDIFLENAGADAWKSGNPPQLLSAKHRTDEEFKKWKPLIVEALAYLSQHPNLAIVTGRRGDHD